MSAAYRPYLVVTVDTEEDNWIPTRTDISVENIREVPTFQQRLEELNVRPTYLVSYQVATVSWAADLLAELHHSGRAEVGAHLHPWNTPPTPEPMEPRYHQLGNLDADLQRQKLSSLCEKLRRNLGVEPRSFRSGLWSLGRDTVRLLTAEGFRVDTSILPYVYWHDVPYSPSYTHAPARPYRLAAGRSLQRDYPDGSLLEVPATAGYTQGRWRLWGPVDRLLRTRPMIPFHLPGLLARMGLVERIPLTPEVTPLRKMIRLTEAAARRRLPVLNVFLHSSSLLPGANDYVRSENDRELLLRRTERYLTQVRERYDALPVTVGELEGVRV